MRALRGRKDQNPLSKTRSRGLRGVKEVMIFKCPYCAAEYEIIMARLSFRQRSYAKCGVCHRTMYSWNSQNVPLFTFVNASEDKASAILL